VEEALERLLDMGQADPSNVPVLLAMATGVKKLTLMCCCFFLSPTGWSKRKQESLEDALQSLKSRCVVHIQLTLDAPLLACKELASQSCSCTTQG